MTKGLSNFSNLTSGVTLPYAGEARQERNSAENDLKERLGIGVDLKKFLEDNGGANLVSGNIKYTGEDFDHFFYVENSSESINKARNSNTKEEAKQHWSKALEYCNKAIELKPNAKDQYHNRGIVYFDTGFLEEALGDFYRELEISPNCASYNSIGMIYHNQGEYRKAIDSFNEAIALDPNAAWHHHHRGSSYLELGFPEKAFEDFSREAEISHNPNSISKKEELIALKNEATSLHEQGRELQKYGNNEAAIECFSHAIELFPDKHWQHFDRGLSYFRTGLKKEALDDFSKELEINPHPIAQERSNHEMAFIYISIQDYDKSKYHSKKVIEIDNDANLVARAKLNVGYLEDRAQKEADDKYWQDWRDYLFLGKQVAKLAVTVLLPVIRELLKKQNPADYLSEEDSEENVKTLARNMVEISLKFEGMPQKDRDALLAIDAEKSKEIFSAIFSLKDPAQLDDFISNTLREVEDPNKEALKEILKELHSSIIDTGTTMNKRNFVYDKIIEDTDSSKHPIIPKKLEECLKIFRDEAARYMMEIHDQVETSEVKNVLDELIDKVKIENPLNDTTQEPPSIISVTSPGIKLTHNSQEKSIA
jgi:tetratricopeptide (TPR) repeat protein